MIQGLLEEADCKVRYDDGKSYTKNVHHRTILLGEGTVALNLLQIVLGVILGYLGYQIADKTTSDAISLMGWIVAIIGVVLVAAGIGVIPFPFFSG